MVARGTVTNVTLQVRSRDVAVGIKFTGLFKVPVDGVYTFWTRSDDGSQLSLGDPLRLPGLGRTNLPTARKFVPGQWTGQDYQWRRVEAEGVITHVRQVFQSVTVELAFGAGRPESFWPWGPSGQ